MRTIQPDFTRSIDLNEIIFANRNKLYGAYELRRNYHERLAKSLLITITFSLLLLLIVSFILHHQKTKEIIILIPDVFTPEAGKFIIEETKIKPVTSVQENPTPPKENEIHAIVNDSADVPAKKDTTSSSANENKSAPGEGTTTSGARAWATAGISDSTTASGSSGNDWPPVPEIYPSFPGGQKAFSKYLQKKFDCDGLNISAEEGKIIIRFIVTKDGAIAQPQIMSDNAGTECAASLLNAIKNSPKWNPGLQNNQPVNVMMVLPVTVQKQ